MDAPRILRLAAVLAFPVLVSRAAAQSLEVVFPASAALPNYDRIPVGQSEGLESGAYVARSGDAGSAWYNPAGLVLSEKSELNASSNAYEFNSVTLEGVGTSRGSTRFSPVETYFGAVLGAPIIHSDRWRVGFGYTKSVSWAPDLIDGNLKANHAGSTELIGFTTSANFSTVLPELAVGYRVSPRFRLGWGLGLAFTDMRQSQAVSDRYFTPTGDTTALRNVSLDGSSRQLVFSLGAQWDLNTRVKIGALLVPPGLTTAGSAKVIYSLTGFSTNGSRDVVFQDADARFEYRIPVKLVAGVSVDLGKLQLELDARYHGSTGSYDLLSSQVFATRIVTDAAGVATLDSIPFATIREKANAVVNIAVGGSYLIANGIRLHAGFFNDASPVDNSGASIFRSLDLYGGSLGISFTGKHFSGSLGTMGSFGTTDDRQLGTSLGGLTQVTRLKITNVMFVYAVSYKF